MELAGDNNPFAGRSGVRLRDPLAESEKAMKRKLKVNWLGLGCLAVALTVRGAETNSVAGRVGVYDSRVVAYAWFSSEATQANLKEQVAAARAAKQAGDQVNLKDDSEALRALQDQMHREVFSTAPANEALAMVKARLPEIEQAAGVSNLVSKWDAAALGNFKSAVQVDVTDQMVRLLFKPTEQQLKVIEGIKKADPVPLEECNELIRNRKI